MSFIANQDQYQFFRTRGHRGKRLESGFYEIFVSEAVYERVISEWVDEQLGKII